MLAVAFQFEDEDEALEFANAHPQKIVGIYKVPTIFCEEVHTNAKKTQQGFTQGQRWGWWVCAYCKKPKKTAYLHIWEYMSLLGNNLMTRLVQEGKLVSFTKGDAI